MNKRQMKLGVTEEGYQEGVVQGHFLYSEEAFLAKACQWRKGSHQLEDLMSRTIGDVNQLTFGGFQKRDQRNFLESLIDLCQNLPKHFSVDWETHVVTVQ